MAERIILLIGKRPGRTSCILAGVHGNEKCGIQALENLNDLEIERGMVLIARGNPRAIEKNIRFIEADLNRMFMDEQELSAAERETYEYDRARFIKNLLCKSHSLLDIHSSSIANSEAFIICEENASEAARYFPVDWVVSGFDTVQPGGTDYYMNRKGKTGLCLECGDLNDPRTTIMAEQGILTYLKTQGHIVNDLKPRKQRYVRVFKKYCAKNDQFKLSKTFSNFEVLAKNQLVGVDGREEIRAPQQSLILFAHNGTKVGDEVFLLGEEKESLV